MYKSTAEEKEGGGDKGEGEAFFIKEILRFQRIWVRRNQHIQSAFTSVIGCLAGGRGIVSGVVRLYEEGSLEEGLLLS